MKYQKSAFGALLRSQFSDVMVSESAVTPSIRLVFLGRKPIKLDGNDEWDAELEMNDTFGLFRANTARSKPAVLFKIERKWEAFTMPNHADFMRLLCASKFPKKLDLTNLLYATKTIPRGLQKLWTMQEDTDVGRWHIRAGVSMWVDKNKRTYLDFDLRTPLEDSVAKTVIAQLRRAFEKSQLAATESGGTSAKRVTRTKVEKDDTPLPASIPEVEPQAGTRKDKVVAQSNVAYVAVMRSKSRADSVWAVYSPTVSGLTAAITSKAVGNTDADYETYEVRRVPRKGKLIEQLGNRCVLLQRASVEPVSEFVRMKKLNVPVVDNTEHEVVHERDSSEIDLDKYGHVSWSEYDPNTVNLTLAKLFNEGFFDAKMRPRVTTKGLVFDYPHGVDGRSAVIGAARRVYQWFSSIGAHVASVHAKFAPSKALIRFEFPPLLDAQRESIRRLLVDPPKLNAPMYKLDKDTDIRTFQVWDVNMSTGEVHLYPVRQGRTLNTEPVVAYYTQLRKILA